MEFKALVANSNSKDRKNITQSLKECGVSNIVETNDSKQAIEQLQKGKFDVIFTECGTDCCQSEELVKAARKSNSKATIIVTASQSKKTDELKKAFPNATKYLTTPFTHEQFEKTVGEYLPTVAC